MGTLVLAVIGAVFNPLLVSGPDAARVNPAQLAYPERPGFACRILSLDVGLGNNSFTFGQYNRFTGAYLEQDAKDEILGSVPKRGMVLALSGGAGAAEFGYDNIAVSVRTQARGSAVLPKDVFDLALNGNALDRVYEAGGLDAEAQVVWRAGLSAGTALGRNVTLGVGANYLHGLLDARLVEADADFLTTPSEFVSAGGLVYRRASGGTGWAFDVGATLSQGAWRYSLGCLDLGPGIVWHQGVEQGTYSFELDSVNAYDIAKAHGFTQQFSRGGSSSYRTAWPATVNLGLGRRFGDWLNCGLLLQGRGAGKLGLETALLSSVEFWPWAWMPLGLDLGYSSCRGMVAGVNAGLIWRGLVLSGGATNEAGLLLAARGVSYRLGIGYGTAMAERVSKPDILRIHYEGD